MNGAISRNGLRKETTRMEVNLHAQRQVWLLNYLCQFAIAEPERWLTEKEICEAYAKDHDPNTWDRYIYKENAKGSKCSAIYTDMDELNTNMAVHKIIITHGRKYKVSVSREETEKYYLNSVYERLKNASHRKSLIEKKMVLDGQMTLDGEVIEVYGEPVQH